MDLVGEPGGPSIVLSKDSRYGPSGSASKAIEKGWLELRAVAQPT
jgi:hypothetical protein